MVANDLAAILSMVVLIVAGITNRLGENMNSSTDPYVFTAVIGVLSLAVGALIWVIKFMFTKLLPTIEGLTTATRANTSATKSADTYLRQRNGRDIEKHEELLKATEAIPQKMQKIADTQAKTLIENLKKLPAQNIEHQHVKDQTIENQT